MDGSFRTNPRSSQGISKLYVSARVYCLLSSFIWVVWVVLELVSSCSALGLRSTHLDDWSFGIVILLGARVSEYFNSSSHDVALDTLGAFLRFFLLPNWGIGSTYCSTQTHALKCIVGSSTSCFLSTHWGLYSYTDWRRSGESRHWLGSCYS